MIRMMTTPASRRWRATSRRLASSRILWCSPSTTANSACSAAVGGLKSAAGSRRRRQAQRGEDPLPGRAQDHALADRDLARREQPCRRDHESVRCEFDAFAAMVDQGQSVEQVALAFGVTIRQVTERLRYGRVHKPTSVRRRAAAPFRSMRSRPSPRIPCQETQKRVFDDLATSGAVREWSVRQRLKEADIMQGDPLAQFVGEDYRAKGGDVIPALFEEETVLSDRGLVETIALEKLQAAGRRDRGGPWLCLGGRAGSAVDYGDLSKLSPHLSGTRRAGRGGRCAPRRHPGGAGTAGCPDRRCR